MWGYPPDLRSNAGIPEQGVAARVDGMATARELLLAEQRRARERAAALEREFAGLAEAASSAGTDDEHDPEGATLAFERQHAAALLEAAREQLAAIDAALGRPRPAATAGANDAGSPSTPTDWRPARPRSPAFTARRSAEPRRRRDLGQAGRTVRQEKAFDLADQRARAW